MAGLNLRGDPLPSEKPPPPEEPLGLDLIRGWLAKPRPRLYRLWLWVPHTAKGVRRAHLWLRANAGPALRRAARTLRRAAAVADALRRSADRIGGWLQTAFPPGSRGREVARHVAQGSRLLGRSALVLLGIGREVDRLPSVFEGRPQARPAGPERPSLEPERLSPEPAPKRAAAPTTPARSPSRTPADPAPEPPRRPAPDYPGASSGAGPPAPGEPAASPGPSPRGTPPAPDGPARSRTTEDPRPGRSPKKRRQPEPSPEELPAGARSQPELSGEDPLDRGPARPTRVDPSPVPRVPPGARADALARLSRNLRADILLLGKRPRKSALRYTVWSILSECGPSTAEDLGLLLQIDPANLAKRHLSPLVAEGALERTIPDRITHPDQAYRATRTPPGQAAPARRA